jgi:hypothetical protein
LLERVSFDGDPIRDTRLLRRVSFDCYPASSFSSHQRRALLLHVFVFAFRQHSLSLLRRPLAFRQHSLSLSSQGPAGLPRLLPLAARALRITHSLSLESLRYSRVAGRMRDDERGQRTSIAASSKADASVPSLIGSAPSSVLSPRPRRLL